MTTMNKEKKNKLMKVYVNYTWSTHKRHNNMKEHHIQNNVKLSNVVSLVADNELGGQFLDCTTEIGLYNVFNGLGHTQNRTPVKTDNPVANSLSHSEIRAKHSKSWEVFQLFTRKKGTKRIHN